MEYLAQFLRSITNDPLIFKIAFTITVAMSMFIFAMGLLFLLATVFDPVRRRLRLLSSGEIDHTGFCLRQLQHYI